MSYVAGRSDATLEMTRPDEPPPPQLAPAYEGLGTGKRPARVAGERLQPAGPESAAYIADLASEMARMARGSGLEVLAYLLDMARLEAETTVLRLSRDRVAS